MDIPEIIERLEWYNGTFPHRAVQEAVARKQQIIPVLLGILEEATSNAAGLLEQEDYMGHFYALYLLAQFREKRAYPLIVNFFSLPGELPLDLTGDLVTEDLNSILASVSRGDGSLIERLAENESADEYVRNAALEALLCLVVAGERSREEVMAYYKGLFHRNLSREPSHFWSGLVSCCTDLYPEEVYEEIKQAFDEDLIDETFIDLEFIDQKLALGKVKVLEELEDHGYGLIEDTIKEMEWWACFQEPKQQQVVVPKKVGRNEPCPCGSGRKYKKCCGG